MLCQGCSGSTTCKWKGYHKKGDKEDSGRGEMGRPGRLIEVLQTGKMRIQVLKTAGRQGRLFTLILQHQRVAC
jgi:hypothetical protein